MDVLIFYYTGKNRKKKTTAIRKVNWLQTRSRCLKALDILGCIKLLEAVHIVTLFCTQFSANMQLLGLFPWERRTAESQEPALCSTCLFLSSMNKPSPLQQGRLNTTRLLACLRSHGCLVCWDVSVPILLAFSAASSSTEAPGTTCPLPQSLGWVFLSV